MAAAPDPTSNIYVVFSQAASSGFPDLRRGVFLFPGVFLRLASGGYETQYHAILDIRDYALARGFCLPNRFESDLERLIPPTIFWVARQA